MVKGKTSAKKKKSFRTFTVTVYSVSNLTLLEGVQLQDAKYFNAPFWNAKIK